MNALKSQQNIGFSFVPLQFHRWKADKFFDLLTSEKPRALRSEFPHVICNDQLSPRLHEYVLIENDIVFNETAMIVLHLHIVFVSLSFSVGHTKTMKRIENGKNQRKFIVCVSRYFEWFVVVVASFSKVCVFSENDPSTRQRQYHYNNIVFKSFHFGDRFQKLSFSVKTIIIFYRFRIEAR